MNVQFTYNITYAEQLPPRYLEQVRDLVNWHEYNLFTDSQASGIGNSTLFIPTFIERTFDFRIVAGRSILPTILDALSNIGSQLPYGLQLHFSAVSYQPFLSLMNMTGMFEPGQLPPAIGMLNEPYNSIYRSSNHTVFKWTMLLHSYLKCGSLPRVVNQ